MIEARNLIMIYDGNAVIENLSFTLPDAGIVAISGPSGAGKTTLMRMLCGLETPLSGEIVGLPEKVAVAFQEARLLPWYSGVDNIKATVPEVSEDDIYASLLRLGISKEDAAKRPAELSGGMNQRICLARAFLYQRVCDCKLLLLDEPFNGLDEENRQRAIGVVKEIAASIPVVLISHIEKDLEICDKVIEI